MAATPAVVVFTEKCKPWWSTGRLFGRGRSVGVDFWFAVKSKKLTNIERISWGTIITGQASRVNGNWQTGYLEKRQCLWWTFVAVLGSREVNLRVMNWLQCIGVAGFRNQIRLMCFPSLSFLPFSVLFALILQTCRLPKLTFSFWSDGP